MSHKILIIDDDRAVREVLTSYLTEMEYEVESAESGKEAFEHLKQGAFSLVLCDIVMPGGMDGIQTLVEIKKFNKDLPVIMVSGMGTHDLIIKSFEKGAVDFIPKPLNWMQVNKIVKTYLETEVDQYVEKNSPLAHLLQDSYKALLNTLITVLEGKDTYLKGHCVRVARLSVTLAEELNLPPDMIEVIRSAALLHDIGEVGVCDVALLKAGKLTEDEWKQLKQHPVIGYKLISELKFFRAEEPLILHHHEHYDGSGYPDGLKGDQIPFGSRVITLADAYDAMTSPRPWRVRFTEEQAINEIRNNVGKQFDPELARKFLEILQHGSLMMRVEDLGLKPK